MQREIERYQARPDCSAMGAEIGEEAGSSAHRSAGAGVAPASHNTRLPWRQTHTNTHTNKLQAVGNTFLM